MLFRSRHLHHVGIGPVVMTERDLGHDDDERPALGMEANGLGQTDLCLVHALRAALSAAVQEEDDGPGAVFGPVFRKVNLVFVDVSVDGDMAVEKAGVDMARSGVRGECREQGEDENDEAFRRTAEAHCWTG